MEDDKVDKLMQRHKSRKLIDFVPYWCRPSEGGFLRREDAQGHCVLTIEVQGLGELTIRADGVGAGNEAFCSITELVTT